MELINDVIWYSLLCIGVCDGCTCICFCTSYIRYIRICLIKQQMPCFANMASNE